MNIELRGIANPVRVYDKIKVPDEPNATSITHPQVTFAAPLVGRPAAVQTVHELWLDANILSQALTLKQSPNIREVIRVAASEGMIPSPTMAIIEFFRTNEAFTALDIIFKRLPIFEQLYGVIFDMPHVSHLCEKIPEYLKEKDSYLDSVADNMTLVRHFFNEKDRWEVKCELLAKFINENSLPVFKITYLIGCLYFYIKDNRAAWPSEFFGKIQKDMALQATAEKNRKCAKNLASDIILFTAGLLAPIQKDGSLHIAHIATSDWGLSFILQEICYLGIHVERGVVNGVPAFRPGSTSDIAIGPTALQNMQKYFSDHVIDKKKLDHLTAIAEELSAEDILETKTPT